MDDGQLDHTDAEGNSLTDTLHATPPILLIIFNRPDTTQLVFDVIAKARPTKLYIAADGPRPDRPGEGERAQAARDIAKKVDWPCEVQTLYQETNLGCRQGVTTAITWFFDNEEAGIILEDDIVPDLSFFPYCAELLNRYRDDERIMAITGLNRLSGDHVCDHSYYFSAYPHVWGWASWRRAWSRYDRELASIENIQTKNAIRQISDKEYFYDYWMKRLRGVRDGEIDTWDYSWLLTCWLHGGLTCTPNRNLIRNIGFGTDATHTFDENAMQANMVTHSIDLPLVHPDRIQRDVGKDDYVALHEYAIKRPRLRKRIKRWLRGIIAQNKGVK